jgi:POT family proton-dependent oligopeptide transporter
MENAAAAQKDSFISLVRSLPANFWFANFMEILERLAFFGVRAIAALYLVAKSNENGLELTYVQKGNIYAWWALIQCLVPMVSGGYTERYGYRKSLAVAFVINIIGYLGMAQSKPVADYLAGQGWAAAGYWVFLAAACCVALGTAIFKPPCHGTIAKTTEEKTSSLGWGLFYWVVNIGGALAPMCAAQLRGEIDWHYVFYGAAIVTACNFIPLLLLYREPEKEPAKEGDSEKGPIGTFFSSIATMFRDLRLVAFLLIFACFWLMFMQLWDLLPNFVDEWVDTSDVAPVFGAISDGWVLENGQTKPEMIININSISIILLVLLVSWIIRKLNKVAAMIIGMLIALVGFTASGSTMLGWFCCLAILIFSIGEMTCSPTFSAYVGLIAPKDKKALYMGYSNIPFAIGWALGNVVGGYFYDHYGAKANLALKELAGDVKVVARAAQAADWSDALEKIPPLLGIDRDRAFELARERMGLDADKAAEALRQDFRYDQGQLENLALQYVALHPDNNKKTISGFTDVLRQRVQALAAAIDTFSAEVKTMLESRKPVSQPAGAAASAPADQDERALTADDEIQSNLEDIRRLVDLVRQLAAGETDLERIGIARFVHVLPTATGTQRSGAFDAVRELLQKQDPDAGQMGNAAIAAMLWERFGDDPQVLNNLALEYLAQATDAVRNAIVEAGFEYPREPLDSRIKEIGKRIGIRRDESFRALSAAIGGNEARLQEALSKINVATGRPADRLFVYLVEQPEVRFEAVSQKNWTKDLGLLREMIRTDPKALAIVRAEIDQEDWVESLFNSIKRLFVSEEGETEGTEEGVDYRKLAGKSDLLRKALATKDWTRAPEQAAQLLGMNPFEARARATAAPKEATQRLWKEYHPYVVWYYLGAIGLAGTIGMILFYFATRRAVAERSSETAAA